MLSLERDLNITSLTFWVNEIGKETKFILYIKNRKRDGWKGVWRTTVVTDDVVIKQTKRDYIRGG